MVHLEGVQVEGIVSNTLYVGVVVFDSSHEFKIDLHFMMGRLYNLMINVIGQGSLVEKMVK